MHRFSFPFTILLFVTATCRAFQIDSISRFHNRHRSPSGAWFRAQFYEPQLKKSSFTFDILKLHAQSDETEKEKRQSFQKDIQEKFTEDRSYNNFGLLTPIAESLDSLSGDWALSYADLSPSTPRTIEGQAFLATNVAYAVAGIILGSQGDWLFAGLTELAGAVSFYYHFIQLEFGKDRTEVRLALLTDYFTAGAALLTGGYYMADMGISAVPFTAVISGGAAIVCLSLCWVWEFGYPYLFWHSLWHLGSAYTGYLIGQAHLGIE